MGARKCSYGRSPTMEAFRRPTGTSASRIRVISPSLRKNEDLRKPGIDRSCEVYSMIVATAGHIDHGKTLLVKTLTGVDTDRLPEEKARGISIDLGFAYWKTGSGDTIGFVD